MSESRREHWDRRYREGGVAPVLSVPPPLPAFAHVHPLFPTRGRALEIACGRGRGAVWLVSRGMTYRGVDVSPVAIELARQLVERSGVADKCRFDVFDLDAGLPEGESVDLVLCYLFRDPRLDRGMVDRLVPGGLLAVAVRSEVDVGPEQFPDGSRRARRGELRDAFGHLEILDEGESDGMARILTRKPG
jgi:SAM-dependent methyltransferase